jgi:transcriptional regulator with XRE-family HTH domain
MTGDDESERGYVIRVGAWIRSIRRQKHLSLQDVEAATDHEFKASVLGAYERGERAISVPRLQRLARFYRVPVDRMLPHDDELGLRSANGSAPVLDPTDPVRSRPLAVP